MAHVGKKVRRRGRPKGSKNKRDVRPGRVETTPAPIGRADDLAEALGYRRRGYTIAQIAESMGCAPSSAHRYVVAALESLPMADTEALRRLECERLDDMMVKSYEAALTGDVRSVNAVIKIMNRRAKCLVSTRP